MDQRLHVITIGADNLRDMVNFYTGVLNWKPVFENTAVAFFKLNGFLVSIVQKQLLENFTGIPSGKKETSCFTLGYNLTSKQEVIGHYETLKRKNIRIVKEPVEPDAESCFFYFADIENNIFEVSCNPSVIMDDNENVINYTCFDDL